MSFRPSRKLFITLGPVIALTAVALVTLSPGPASGAPTTCTGVLADALVPVVKKAKTSGIKVITYDADVADPTARQWFVNQATFTLAGAALVDVVTEQAGASARFAVVSTDPGAFSQNSWIAA